MAAARRAGSVTAAQRPRSLSKAARPGQWKHSHSLSLDSTHPCLNLNSRWQVNNLGSNEVHRSIKPQILSAFGDIALVLGDRFEKYLDTVRRMLQQAMHLSIVQVCGEDAGGLGCSSFSRIRV